jgi:ribosomal protein L14E/L6E/L27E
VSVVNISMGQLVTSIAGRDEMQVYLVVGITNNNVLLLANGRERKMLNPKRKNIRHVNVLKSIAKGAAEKLQSGMKVTDEEIRQAIQDLYKPENL